MDPVAGMEKADDGYVFDKLAEAASLLGIRVPTLETHSAHRSVDNLNECLRLLLQEDPTKRPNLQRTKLMFAFYSRIEPCWVDNGKVFHTTELWRPSDASRVLL